MQHSVTSGIALITCSTAVWFAVKLVFRSLFARYSIAYRTGILSGPVPAAYLQQQSGNRHPSITDQAASRNRRRFLTYAVPSPALNPLAASPSITSTSLKQSHTDANAPSHTRFSGLHCERRQQRYQRLDSHAGTAPCSSPSSTPQPQHKALPLTCNHPVTPFIFPFNR